MLGELGQFLQYLKQYIFEKTSNERKRGEFGRRSVGDENAHTWYFRTHQMDWFSPNTTIYGTPSALSFYSLLAVGGLYRYPNNVHEKDGEGEKRDDEH